MTTFSDINIINTDEGRAMLCMQNPDVCITSQEVITQQKNEPLILEIQIRQGKILVCEHSQLKCLDLLLESDTIDTLAALNVLSPKEISVIRYLASGYSVSDIARRRCRSVKTISGQKINALKKLDLKNEMELHLWLTKKMSLKSCSCLNDNSCGKDSANLTA